MKHIYTKNNTSPWLCVWNLNAMGRRAWELPTCPRGNLTDVSVPFSLFGASTARAHVPAATPGCDFPFISLSLLGSWEPWDGDFLSVPDKPVARSTIWGPLEQTQLSHSYSVSVSILVPEPTQPTRRPTCGYGCCQLSNSFGGTRVIKLDPLVWTTTCISTIVPVRPTSFRLAELQTWSSPENMPGLFWYLPLYHMVGGCALSKGSTTKSSMLDGQMERRHEQNCNGKQVTVHSV